MYVEIALVEKRVEVGNGTAVKLVDRVRIRGRLLWKTTLSACEFVCPASSPIYRPAQKP
jgi:hypothetical protein